MGLSEIARDLEQVYSGNELEYAKYVLTSGTPDIPKNAFPYVSTAPEGRNFSDGDLLFWYLNVGSQPGITMPLALNGPTGVGKSTMVVYFADKKKMHLSEETPNPSDTVDKYLVKTVQAPQTGNIVSAPGSLALANVYGGIFFLDEAANMDGNNFTAFNKIFQAMKHPFMTQFNLVNFDWGRIQPIIGGNFHDKNPDFDAASRYRFVWREFERPTKDLLKNILKQKFRKASGKPIELGDLIEPKDFEIFPRSDEFEEALSSFCQELHDSLSAYADVNYGTLRNGHSRSSIILPSWVPWFSSRGADKEQTYFTQGKDIEAYIKKAETVAKKVGAKWKSAPDISAAAAVKAGLLYHPEMTPLDYIEVLRDVYERPATAVVKKNKLLSGPVAAYAAGQRMIIEDVLSRWYDVLQKKAR